MDVLALQHLLSKAQGRRVACVGDLMVDQYVYGEVGRISPEAPIPVLLRRSGETMLGAVGNVARNVAALGGMPVTVGVVGDDAAAATAADLLAADGVEGLTIVQPDRPTSVKTRFVAGAQQLLRLDVEDCGPVDAASQRQLNGAIETAATGAGAILLSDYAKGVVTAQTIAACHKAAAATGASMIVDPKGRDFAKYGPATIIKPNALELAVSTGMPTQSDVEVEAALAAALAACEAEAVLVTRAQRGMSLARRGAPVRHFGAVPREVFDVSGAGDTSLAALGLALAAGAPLERAIELAILASGVAVTKVGTAIVTPAELVDAEMAARAPAGAKMATLDAVLGAVQRWRLKGLRVGFTNGCFDILHRGHVAYLMQAREWCDRLIVGINTDSSVHALKGEGRPVNDLDSRAMVLAGLSVVDCVVPFAEATPLHLIEAIRPDVLIKGADYSLDGVVGGEFVASYGGEVRLANLVDGVSTTATIAKMAR